jgi:dCMP deaminase
MRQNKEENLMELATLVAKRSLDPDTQHGCIAVGANGAILSTGYNGPPRNVNDAQIPLTRPEKYTFFEHAERNCIYNAARNGTSLEGCTFYVTGVPCVDCLRAMYQVGAVKIVYADKLSACLNEETFKFMNFIKDYICLKKVTK